MERHQPLGNGQPQADPSGGFNPGAELLVGPNMGNLLRGHALAIVHDVQGVIVFLVGSHDVYRFALPGKLEGVINQLFADFLQGGFRHLQIAHFKANLQVIVAEIVGGNFGGLPPESARGQLPWSAVERFWPTGGVNVNGLQFRHQHQVLIQQGHLMGIVQNGFGIAGDFYRIKAFGFGF